jgi:hypothetical protein
MQDVLKTQRGHSKKKKKKKMGCAPLSLSLHTQISIIEACEADACNINYFSSHCAIIWVVTL